jgi:hypothetical protein
VLSAPNSPAPRPDAGVDSHDDTLVSPESQRQAIMQRRAETATAKLQQQSTTDTEDDPDAPVVMGFIWPCHYKPTAYSKARIKADRAGKILRPILQMLRDRGNTTLIVAHSMGSRVALTALLEP